MIDERDPPRLRDGVDASPLREALRAAERDIGTELQVASLAAKLGPLLAPPVAATTTSTAVGLSSAAKAGLGIAALIVVGGGVWLLAARQEPRPAPAVSVVPASTPAMTRAPSAASEPMAAVPSSAHEPTTVVAPPPAPAKQADKPTPPSEAELLEQARSALAGDPARALARANQHAARFPGGALVQEREVIAIKALQKLGRTAEADRRAAAFVKAFPGSAFARKLQATP